MAIVRQEINILDHVMQGVGLTPSVESNERVQLDTTQYNGTATYYFEIVAKSDATGGGAQIVRLVNTTTTQVSITVTDTTSTYTLYRSSSFTPTSSVISNVFARIVGNANNTGTFVKSARIVIIQEATTLTNTETQIEIGNYNLARTAEAATILTNPKYWKYDASKWDGTKTFYAEAVYDSGDMDTISVYLYESAAIDAPSWSSVATIVSAATTTTPTRTRVAFTPTDGRWYTIFSLNGSMDNHDIYRAGIVVQQNDGESSQILDATLDRTFVGGNSVGNTGAEAQSFQLTTGANITGVKLSLRKNNSPTDTINVDLVSTLGGSSLANGTISSSSLTSSRAWYTITFGTPYTVTANTKYYIQLTRSPDNEDLTNYIGWAGNSASVITGIGRYDRTNGTWGSEQAADLSFVLLGTGFLGFTKLEPQYLLANTLFAAGTGLQTFLTDWDSTEWDAGAGTITYNSQAEAANGSTSDVTIEEADGGGTVTNSTLTNIDNAQISSSALTMPADQNLDTKATTNAGDVAAARILVTYVFSAAAEIVNVPYTNPNLKSLNILGVGT